MDSELQSPVAAQPSSRPARLIERTDTLVTVCDVTVSRRWRRWSARFGRPSDGSTWWSTTPGLRTSEFSKVRVTEWRAQMAADVESLALVTQAALPSLLVRGGSVINVASLAGLPGYARMTMYNAAKGAVANLTRSLAIELGPQGISDNGVAPSLTLTDATADIPPDDVTEFIRRIPLGRAAQPSEIAERDRLCSRHRLEFRQRGDPAGRRRRSSQQRPTTSPGSDLALEIDRLQSTIVIG